MNLNYIYPIIMQSEIISAINFEVFGIGAIVFVLLSVWLKVTYSEKKKLEEKINSYEQARIELLEKLADSEKTSITLMNDFNNLITSIHYDIKESNFSNNTLFKTSSSESSIKLQELKMILENLTKRIDDLLNSKHK